MQQEVTKRRKIRHKTYQNAQICYERGDMGEKSVRRLPGSFLVHYILEDFREDFPEDFQKSDPDLENLHIQNYI